MSPKNSYAARATPFLMHPDFSNKKVGFLTIIKLTKKESRGFKRYWLCECSCGHRDCKKIIQTPHSSLLRKQVRSCGMARRMSQDKISGTLFDAIKRGAVVRNLKFLITKEQIQKLFIKQERKCAISGVPLKFSSGCKTFDGTASLDRIDSKRGYTTDNIQWIHKDLNYMKQDFPEKDFFEWINIIHNFQLSLKKK